jgi:hypothetical protein
LGQVFSGEDKCTQFPFEQNQETNPKKIQRLEHENQDFFSSIVQHRKWNREKPRTSAAGKG